MPRAPRPLPAETLGRVDADEDEAERRAGEAIEADNEEAETAGAVLSR
jgi:hypothetical protein